jgi:hypothetical protein
MTASGVLAARRALAPVRAAGAGASFVVVVVLGLLAGDGWLYILRGVGWFAVGPAVGDSLPLLQLAGFDGQPLLRVALAWLLAGGVAGLALTRVSPRWRAGLVGVLALVLLALASQASYALARNLRFTSVLLNRGPGLGPWLEALLFTAGCVLPRRSVSRPRRRRVRRPPVLSARSPGHFGLGGGEDGNAAEHDRDRHQVGDDRNGVRA